MNKINPDENRDYLFYDLGSGAPTAISHRCPSWPWGGFIPGGVDVPTIVVEPLFEFVRLQTKLDFC